MQNFSAQEILEIAEKNRLDKTIGAYKRRMLVYLSGKYRDADEHTVDCNIQYAKRVAVQLWKMGYAVICPHANSQHMGFVGDGSLTLGDSCFLEGDMSMVERSDLVVMLDGWESSKGAKLERRLALRLGILVYYWGTNQLALKRIAENDCRYRGIRASIFGRAARIAEITGYKPDEYIAPASAEEICDSCGASRSARYFLPESQAPADRFNDSLASHLSKQATASAAIGSQV